jgi:tRNA A-37 threonylcarbamoyl transferase component Bud32/tetratricopeptide (TPR) repeat protein
MDWSRVKALFSAAVELPAGERAAFLERESAGDAGLLAEVQSLLDSHDAGGDFLESVSPGLRVAALQANTRAGAGERIGAYRLMEMIGTGGMGDVYRAVRDDEQYRAEVAIKLMRADIRNPLAEQRFKTERQILAGLDHRNIARLLDGGTTPSGLPYVVMELVVGEPIDRYCEQHALGPRERVQLFLQVCAAVSYAHQHLVVHRDLKPNNIFVTADGSVKLLDFGIAKLIDADAPTDAKTAATVTQLRAMTLEYASPEQVSGGAVTTVSDVYSLGVVLYRLVTGQSPYRTTGNDAARVAEILGDTTPTRPSLAATRERHPIDGDLDHVLLMALRKEPQKRYGSVEQFANDLRNHLGGLPVLARRGTLGYRFGKFMRRNKVPIAAAMLVAVSLIGGLAFAIREAREAERQRAVAQRHFDSVRSLANKLIDFNQEVSKLDNSTRAQETLVKTALQYLDTLHRESGSDVSLQEELGIAYGKVAEIQGSQMGPNRGDPQAAMATYAKSNALLEAVIKANPKNAKAGAFLGDSYMRQARTLLYTAGVKPALVAADRAVQLCESSRPGFENEGMYVASLGDSLAIQAQTLGVLNRNDEAKAATGKLIALSEEFTRAHPDDELALRGLAKAYINAAITDDPRETPAQRVARAEPLLRKAMAVQQQLIALDPARNLFKWNLAETQYNLGDMLFDNGQTAAALELSRQASVAMARHDPDDARAVLVNAMNDMNLVKALVKEREFAEAETVLARVEPVLRKSLKEGRTAQNEYFMGGLCLQRGLIELERRNLPRARQVLGESVALFENVNKTIELTGVEKVFWDQARAELARAEGRASY